MKNYFILLFTIFSATLIAQSEEIGNQYFVDLNLTQFSNVNVLPISDLNLKLAFASGFRVGVRKESIEFYAGIIRQNTTQQYISIPGPLLNGSERHLLSLGTNKAFGSNRLKFRIGSELLLKHISYWGFMLAPWDGLIDVSDVTTLELGIAPVFQLHYELSDRLALLLSTRAGLYYSSHSALFDSGFSFITDYVNHFGLRFYL